MGSRKLSQVLEISAGISHAEIQVVDSHFDDNTIDKMGVTTPQRMLGNESGKCEVPIETASDSNLENSHRKQMRTDAKGTREQKVLKQMTEELLIEQATELLNQKELQNEADRAEAKAKAKAEANRVATLAEAEADRQQAR